MDGQGEKGRAQRVALLNAPLADDLPFIQHQLAWGAVAIISPRNQARRDPPQFGQERSSVNNVERILQIECHDDLACGSGIPRNPLSDTMDCSLCSSWCPYTNLNWFEIFS